MACATLKRARHMCAVADANAKPPCKRRRYRAPPSPPTTRAHQLHPSPFTDAAPKMTSEEIAANIYDEMFRLQRRKRLCVQVPGCVPCPTVGSPTGAPEQEEEPLFTMCQASSICQRMLDEWEAVLRQKYDHVLNAKLAEQYDTFLRFAHDQIRRRYEGVAPSYLS